MSKISEVKNFNFSHVQKTMFLPLWGRYVETKKENPLLVDNLAIDIIASLDFDFSEIENNVNECSALSWVVRAKMTDDVVKDFISRHPNGTIVNIGAGLDTTFNRINNGRLRWFDLDLPDSISFRKNFISETSSCRCIPKSVFDYSWFDDLGNISDNVLFIAAGVLMFFTENQLKELFSKLALRFPQGEIFFDTLSQEGLAYSNNMMKGAGMGDNLLNWGIDSPQTMLEWNDNLILIDDFAYYEKISPQKEWSQDVLRSMNMCNQNKAASFYHFKFK